jgi:hypothetical protein
MERRLLSIDTDEYPHVRFSRKMLFQDFLIVGINVVPHFIGDVKGDQNKTVYVLNRRSDRAIDRSFIDLACFSSVIVVEELFEVHRSDDYI